MEAEAPPASAPPVAAYTFNGTRFLSLFLSIARSSCVVVSSANSLSAIDCIVLAVAKRSVPKLDDFRLKQSLRDAVAVAVAAAALSFVASS